MKKIKLALASLTVVVLTSCSISGPLLITDNKALEKRGEASYTSWLGFPPFDGDISIQTAAKNGGITKVATVDQRIYGGFFRTTVTTIVTGE
ncbi:TRL domain-containing protein [Crocinitomix algicola]|uniref:TRL domain-containing protein n=1 Tax=Crocinitomix algicola TaxID=1740263 RepID=UPI00082B8308|nr:TRL domain-containing protein [Crocinitomix algicola]